MVRCPIPSTNTPSPAATCEPPTSSLCAATCRFAPVAGILRCPTACVVTAGSTAISRFSRSGTSSRALAARPPNARATNDAPRRTAGCVSKFPLNLANGRQMFGANEFEAAAQVGEVVSFISPFPLGPAPSLRDSIPMERRSGIGGSEGAPSGKPKSG